ncbi:carbonic anhydrase 14 isoform X2 [Ascaphus truei]|uniref:carbonic anhydrase 14 isoform X2 n=1 Tax=Ascaphus truei TaxID=8439 RepID=UPI003F5AA29E
MEWRRIMLFCIAFWDNHRRVYTAFGSNSTKRSRMAKSYLILDAYMDRLHIFPAGSPWEYAGPHGQDQWPDIFPDCGGSSQSPVNIQTVNVSLDQSLTPIHPVGYSTPGTGPLTLRNNGHTVALALPPSMRLQGLPKNFTAVELHLHWGSSSPPRWGSEHQIDGEMFSAEVHIVHYNSDKYGNVSQAMTKPDGLAVLGILVETATADNPAYEHILSYLWNVRRAGQFVTIPAFDVHQLLPKHLDQYYRYRGSLTTPPCYQSVLWTIFHQRVQLSVSQLERLQNTLYSSKPGPSPGLLQDNYRAVQPLNQRTIYTSTSVLLRSPSTFSTGQILAIVFGTLLGLVSLSCGIHFAAKKLRKVRMRAAEKPNDVVLQSESVQSFSSSFDVVLQSSAIQAEQVEKPTLP